VPAAEWSFYTGLIFVEFVSQQAVRSRLENDKLLRTFPLIPGTADTSEEEPYIRKVSDYLESDAILGMADRVPEEVLRDAPWLAVCLVDWDKLYEGMTLSSVEYPPFLNKPTGRVAAHH
jgi:hypothetical protein